MSFVCNRSYIVNGAVTAQYVVEHPQLIDANRGNPLTRGLRSLHCEVANMSGGIVYIAFDRAVTPPTGTGVQGPIDVTQYPSTGPMAATPGDFDMVITSGNGWGALDFAIPYGSRSMSVYTVSAGQVTINYGNQL